MCATRWLERSIQKPSAILVFVALAVSGTSALAAPACAPAPVHGCASATRSLLKISRSADPGANRFLWSWKGTATAAQFGDPTAATSYQLCVYDNGTLAGSPLGLEMGTWSAKPGAYRYRGPADAGDGIQGLSLKEGFDGAAKLLVKGKGAGLSAPLLPSAPDSVLTLQLVKDTASGPECWEDVYRTEQSKLDGAAFLAKQQGGGQVLSAFFGLDDALPSTVEFLCPGATGTDGMPVVFRREIDAATLAVGDFRVTTASGATKTPVCVNELPAGERNENRTVLLIGDFGSADSDPPVRVDLVGSVVTEPDEKGKTLDLSGARLVPVSPLNSGPFLVYAETMSPSEQELGQPDALRVGGGCPVAGTLQVIKVAWAGGVRALSGDEPGDAERLRYRVILEDGSVIAPFELADLNDSDNNHDLCLDDARRAVRVEMEAGTLMDPGDDPNPETGVEVVRY